MHAMRPIYQYLAIEYIIGNYIAWNELEIQRRHFPELETIIMSVLFPPFAIENQIIWKINRIRVQIGRKDYEVKKLELKNIPRYKELVEYLAKKYQLTKTQVDKAELFVYFDASPSFTEYLNNVLKKYSAEYVDGILGRLDSYYSFEKQLSIFLKYVDSISETQNVKNFLIHLSDFYKIDKINKGKYRMSLYDFMLALYYAKCINIYGVDFDFKQYPSPREYTMSVGIIDPKALNLVTIRERLGLSELKQKVLVTPQDQNCYYDNDTKTLIFRLSNGSPDGFDFSRAKVSRKVFEVFYVLWRKDKNGEYTREDVCAMYKTIHNNETIQPARVGEIVSNIRTTIIKPKTLIKDKLDWHFDQTKNVWIFKINA